jgi:predicted TIM-barrel fold metal-dependent hydrolase
MIIDAHSHVNITIPGMETSSHSSYDTKTDDLELYLENYEKNGVDACFVFMTEVFSMESRMLAYNEVLAKYRDKYPKRLYPWGTVQPSWPEKKLRQEIRRIKRELGLYGLKFVPLVQGVPLSGKSMDIVAEEAMDLGLPVTFHDGSMEYCSAIQVVYFARKYPGLKVLSAHGGLRELWPDFIDAVKELPNLWLCLSGPTQWGIQKLYDELGPEKLLFGSDGGIGHPAVTTAYIRRIQAMNAPEDHKKMIFGTNAANFLGLDN